MAALGRWDADDVTTVVQDLMQRLVAVFPNPVQFQELRQAVLGIAHEVRMREYVMKTLKDCEVRGSCSHPNPNRALS
jgi:hypothetical protein